MAEPSDDELKAVMKKLLPNVNLEKTSLKKFTKLLSKELGGLDLSMRSKFIKKALTDILNSMGDDASTDEEEQETEENCDENDKRIKSKTRRGGAAGGLAAVKEISDELASFMGKGKQMARTEVVKELWTYIRDNNLQNPENRREIFLDAKMKKVFGVDTFTMFTMNKYVGAHIHPYKPVDLSTNTTKPETKKRKRQQAAGTDGKKSRKSGTQAPYQLSPELSRVVGKQILPRPQVTKALWVYIRNHNLQNPEDKREIICDQKLKAVMGGNDKVTMFTMNKFITPHLLEKLDKSYYTHDSDAEDGTRDNHRSDVDSDDA